MSNGSKVGGQQSIVGRISQVRRAASRGRLLRAARYGRRAVSGFTLIEILVVLGIVTLVAALGVPAFNALSGSRSTEAGRNVVAAALGQARTIAVNEGRYAGILFYVDPATERTAMSLVIVNDPKSGMEDADTYDKYKQWTASAGTGQVTYRTAQFDQANGKITRGDRVIGLTSDYDATYRSGEYTPPPGVPLVSEYLKFFGNYRLTVRTFRCREEHNASNQAGNRPPRNGPTVFLTQRYQTIPSLATNPGPALAESQAVDFSNDKWSISDDREITTYYNAGDQQLLPKGVGVQVIMQPKTITGITERYVRTGCIMFDPQGRLVQRNFSLSGTSDLGKFLDLVTNLGRPTTASNIISGLGVVLYDQQTFKAQSGFSEADWIYRNTAGNTFAIASTGAAFNDATAAGNESAEETWLDNNCVPLLINRYSGSMSEAE